MELILGDGESVRAEAVATTLPGEDEIIISEDWPQDLGIIILNPYSGERCLDDELGSRWRVSAGQEAWR